MCCIYQVIETIKFTCRINYLLFARFKWIKWMKNKKLCKPNEYQFAVFESDFLCNDAHPNATRKLQRRPAAKRRANFKPTIFMPFCIIDRWITTEATFHKEKNKFSNKRLNIKYSQKSSKSLVSKGPEWKVGEVPTSSDIYTCLHTNRNREEKRENEALLAPTTITWWNYVAFLTPHRLALRTLKSDERSSQQTSQRTWI